MKPFRRLAAWVGVVALIAAPARGDSRVRVLGDRVSLRSAPSPNAEVVGQVDKGAILTGGITNGEWLAVTPPASVDLCVHGALVKDGVVSVSKAMVRGGPGINYRAVGTMREGEAVHVRGTWGEWLKIEPPPDCVLWVSRVYTEPVAPPQAAEGGAEGGARAATVTAVAPSGARTEAVLKPPLPEPGLVAGMRAGPRERSRPPPPQRAAGAAAQPGAAAAPAWLAPKTLAAGKPQGVATSLAGVVQTTFIVWRRPSRFGLVAYNEHGVALMTCYVIANEAQMASLKGRSITVHGRQYWVQGVKHPAVIAERIVLNR